MGLEDKSGPPDGLMREILLRIAELRSRLTTIERRLPSVRLALLHRGFRVKTEDSLEHVLLPPKPADLPEYKRLLRRYSFRLLLRDVIANQQGFALSDLLHYCSPRKAQLYLTTLERLEMIKSAGKDRWVLVSNNRVYSFGETFEWYVAQLLSDTFAIPASWSVSIAQFPAGGDFDVLAYVSGKLIYVETKASPPKNIHMDVIEGFARRLRGLRPDVAIFLVDTHLRMQDKLNKMLRAALFGQHPVPPQTTAISRNVFRIHSSLYTANSKSDIQKNLALCLRDALSGPWF